MTRRPARSASALLGLALILTFTSHAMAGDFLSQSGIGATFFNASPPCPAKRMPTFESVVPIPGLFDPFDLQFANFACFVDVREGGEGVKGVKGKYTTQLIVRDNNTGDLDTFDIDSGTFKTNRDGQDVFDFDIPAEIFADGFESGDVSAWSYTRSDFTNKKKVESTAVQCVKSASRSD